MTVIAYPKWQRKKTIESVYKGSIKRIMLTKWTVV